MLHDKLLPDNFWGVTLSALFLELLQISYHPTTTEEK